MKAGGARGQVCEEGHGQDPGHPGSCMQAEQVGEQGHGREGGAPRHMGLVVEP